MSDLEHRADVLRQLQLIASRTETSNMLLRELSDLVKLGRVSPQAERQHSKAEDGLWSQESHDRRAEEQRAEIKKLRERQRLPMTHLDRAQGED